MSMFEYMNFNDGGYLDSEFVCHAKKFTKEQAIEFCIEENDWRFDKECCEDYEILRLPTINDIIERTVRWYIRIPESCCDDGDNDRGIYTYCKKGERGSFPVWVIEFDKLAVPE